MPNDEVSLHSNGSGFPRLESAHLIANSALALVWGPQCLGNRTHSTSLLSLNTIARCAFLLSAKAEVCVG